MRFAAAVLSLPLLAADPAAFAARKSRVRELLIKEEFSTASVEAKKLNKDWPDDVETYQLQAESLLGLGDYAGAEAALQWMLDLRIGKTDRRGWEMLARFREVTGDVDGALEALRLALTQAEPTQSAPLVAFAAHLQALAGRGALAEQSAAQAPDEPLSLRTLARLRLQQGRKSEAIGLARQLAANDPRPRNLYLVATMTGAKADYEAFRNAAGPSPELVLYLAGRGRQPAEALRMAEREITRRRDVWMRAAHGTALAANGKVQAARDEMKQALAVGTRDPEILALAARVGVKPE